MRIISFQSRGASHEREAFATTTGGRRMTTLTLPAVGGPHCGQNIRGDRNCSVQHDDAERVASVYYYDERGSERRYIYDHAHSVEATRERYEGAW